MRFDSNNNVQIAIIGVEYFWKKKTRNEAFEKRVLASGLEIVGERGNNVEISERVKQSVLKRF